MTTEQRDGANSIASMASVSVSLGEQDTDALLHAVPSVYQTRIEEVLVTGLCTGVECLDRAACGSD